jgi:hypothetical protein
MAESKNDRIVYGPQISNKSNLELINKGYTPYYLDLKRDGEYKIVKVKSLKDDMPGTTFYFLSDDEVNKLTKLVENVNNLISEYLNLIKLYKRQLIGVLEQKIIK